MRVEVVCSSCEDTYFGEVLAWGVDEKTGDVLTMSRVGKCPACGAVPGEPGAPEEPPEPHIGPLGREMVAEALCNVCDCSDWAAFDGPVEFGPDDFRRMAELVLWIAEVALGGKPGESLTPTGPGLAPALFEGTEESARKALERLVELTKGEA